MNRLPLFTALLLTLGLALPTPASAARRIEYKPVPKRHAKWRYPVLRPHLGVYLPLGFAGQVRTELQNGLAGKEDAIATVGAGAFAAFSPARFLQLGLLTEFLAWNTELADDKGLSRAFFFNIDGMIRAVAPINGRTAVYFSVPVGLTVSLPGPDGDALQNAVGWNIGARVGVETFFSRYMGGFVELGWRFVTATHDVEPFALAQVGAREVELRLNEAALSLGLLFSL